LSIRATKFRFSQFTRSRSFATQANALIKEEKFKEAAVIYTKALKLTPDSHILYSNRSAAFAGMKRYSRAKQDADKCIELNPTFVKGKEYE
jgi:stress-induced-phosphoprotein 1